MSLSSTDLELISDGGTAQIVGIRFRDVSIPQGTKVVSAVLEFETDETNSGSTSLTIEGQDDDDAAAFTGSNSNISDRTTTSASVAWSPSAWNTVSERHQSPDISSIVQEIVDRSGWSSGNSMVFIISGSGERTAESHNGESSAAPILRLEWDGQESIPGGRVCYGVADTNDRFVFIDTTDGTVDANVGDTGGSAIEAITLDPEDFAIYGADADRLGRINFDTGEMITLPEDFGTGGGSAGNITFDDVDSLAFDPDTGTLWGVDARGGSDALFQIDPATGAHVADAFGSGTDYLLITGTGIGTSIDDIAVDPSDGTLYASDTSNSQLITINTTTGAGTIVGGYGSTYDMEGLGFRFDGVLYGSAAQRLYSVNTTTGAATQVGSGDTLTVGADYEAFECHFTPTSRAMVDAFEKVHGPAGTALAWRTRAEDGTLGYWLYARPAGADWRLLFDHPTPALAGAARGATYLSDALPAGDFAEFLLVEIEASGRLAYHGPFTGEGRGEIELERVGEALPRARPANEQIRSKAGSTRHVGRSQGAKVMVRQTGIHHLTRQVITGALGLDEVTAGRAVESGGLELRHGGRAVAWTPAPGGDGMLFYAEAAADVELEQPLTGDLFAPHNAYRLSLGRGTLMAFAGGPIAGPPAAGEVAFEAYRRFELDVFAGLVAMPDPDGDYWFWHAFSAGTPGFDERTIDFELGSPLAGPARLSVDLFGVSDAGPHRCEIEINGRWIGEARWSGRGIHRIEFDVDGADLLDGVNQLRLKTVLEPSAAWSFLYLDGFELRHWRAFRSDGGHSLAFRTPQGPVRLDGFSEADIAVFDVGDPRRPAVLRPPGIGSQPGDDGTFAVTIDPRTPGRRALAVTPAALLEPQAEPWRQARQPLVHPARRADLLILSPTALVEAAEQLADHRRSQGLEVLVLDLEWIYNEVGHGLATPWAIRDFLRLALTRWQRAPRYVLLLGHGSFDHRGLLGHGKPLVPGLLATGPGGLFAAPWRLLPDGAATVIGRLPVSDAAGVSAYLERLTAHEEHADAGLGLVIADRPAPEADFRRDAERLARAMEPSTSVQLLEAGDGATGEVLASWRSGLDWLSFAGHGSSQAWGSDSFVSVHDLDQPGGRRPVVLASTCLSNRDDFPGARSLGGALVLSEQLGAMAVIAPSGTVAHHDAVLFQEHFWNALATQGGDRLGDILAEARRTYGEVSGTAPTATIFSLLGDPSLVLPGVGGADR